MENKFDEKDLEAYGKFLRFLNISKEEKLKNGEVKISKSEYEKLKDCENEKKLAHKLICLLWLKVVSNDKEVKTKFFGLLKSEEDVNVFRKTFNSLVTELGFCVCYSDGKVITGEGENKIILDKQY